MKLSKALNRILCFTASVFLIMSCSDENQFSEVGNGDNTIIIGEATKSYPGVDQRLWPYFERFEKAGKERGYNTDLIEAEVTGSFEDIENGAAGSCSYNSNHTFHHIRVDNDTWNSLTTNFREFIIFHELGHCYLHREHDEEAHNNGVCQSIMRSGLGQCRDNYHAGTRETYLDELFDDF